MSFVCLIVHFHLDQHKEMRSQLHNRHTMMENHINQLSTMHTNHLGDYVKKAADMIYKHHDMMFQKLGAIAEDTAGALTQKESMSDKTFVSFKRHWYLGNANQTCNQACDSRGLYCTANSVSKQTSLAPDSIVEVVAAFQEAGASCITTKSNHWRDVAGSPFVQSISGDCYGFGKDDGTASYGISICNGNATSGHQPLCYCEESRYEEMHIDNADANVQKYKFYTTADCTSENTCLGYFERVKDWEFSLLFPGSRSWKKGAPHNTVKLVKKKQMAPQYTYDEMQIGNAKYVADSKNLGEPSLEKYFSVQDNELNRWKLPPKLDVQWPKGHSSLWELISNEVGNNVEEVGTSVLTALGANVVTTRRLAGTSEKHFEYDVTWPTGGNHVLEEVKNYLEEVNN